MFKRKTVSIVVIGLLLAAIMLKPLDPVVEVQAAADTSSGLVARWTFDSDITETVSGLTTTLGGKDLEYVDGVLGKAAVFNGKDNYLTVAPNTILDLGNSRTEDSNKLTISAWVNLGESSTGNRYLLDKGKNVGWSKNDKCFWSNPYAVVFRGVEPTLILNNRFQDGSGINQQGSSTTGGAFAEGDEWFLMTVTYDGSVVKIYIDNQLSSQSNYSNGFAFNEDDLFIGVDSYLKNFFKGELDDLRIYNRALSYNDVEGLYQEGLKSNKEFVEPTKQLAAYYAFDGDLSDSTPFGNTAEKVQVDGTTKYVIGKNGKAITMNKGNYIRIPAASQLSFETEFTVSFWLKQESINGTYPIIFRQNPSYGTENDNSSAYQMYLETWHNGDYTNMKMSTLAWDPGVWKPVNGQSLTTKFTYPDDKLKANDWFHFTFTYKDGVMCSYLNGKLRDTTKQSEVIDISNATGDLLIGYDGKVFLEGTMDELKIFNQCLSATEVSTEAKRIDSISLKSSDADKIETMDKGSKVTISTIVLKDIDTGKTSKLKSNNSDIKLTSSDEKIFTVSSSGEIKTKKKSGEATLTITYGGLSKSYKIKVE